MTDDLPQGRADDQLSQAFSKPEAKTAKADGPLTRLAHPWHSGVPQAI